MTRQAISPRWASGAWLGMLMVAGSSWAMIALSSAGCAQPMGPQGAVSPQPAAQVSGAAEAPDQTTAGLARAELAFRFLACKGRPLRFFAHEESPIEARDLPVVPEKRPSRFFAHEESLFRAAARKKDDRIEMQPGKARLLIVVRSPSGIGAATVERTRGQWPAQVVVRLYLRGLESFRAETQNTALSLSVLSHGNNDRLMKLSVNDQAQEIKPGTPTGVEVRVFNAEGKPAEGLPPAGGCFEVHLPQVMLSGNPAELRLEWIDFYRG